jgi:esterase/lipase
MKKIIEKCIGLYFNSLTIVNPTLASKKLFKLFCNPMCKPLKPYQVDFLNKGKDKILLHEDLKIQTYKWGNGNKHVLLIHGWSSNTFRWKNYIESLIEHDFTVYAFDAPAHGLSSGKMFHLILYSQIIELYIQQHEKVDSIVSHSIGGFATIFWLFKHKQNNIKKVVTMGAPGEAKDFFDFYQKTLGLTNKTMKLLTDEFLNLVGYTPNFFSAPTFAKELQTKALIIHDKDDFDAHSENSIRLHKQWQKSELLLTTGLGHSLKSKDVMQKVIQFL